MIDVYYNEKELDKTRVNVKVDGDDLFNLMADVATMVGAIINVVTVRHYAPENRLDASEAMKGLVIEMLKSMGGTDIESFEGYSCSEDKDKESTEMSEDD